MQRGAGGHHIVHQQQSLAVPAGIAGVGAADVAAARVQRQAALRGAMPQPLQRVGIARAVQRGSDAPRHFPRGVEAALQQALARKRYGQNVVGQRHVGLRPARTEQVAKPAAQRGFCAELHAQNELIVGKSIVAQRQGARPPRGMQQTLAADLPLLRHRHRAARAAWTQGQVFMQAIVAQRLTAARVAMGAATGPERRPARGRQNRTLKCGHRRTISPAPAVSPPSSQSLE